MNNKNYLRAKIFTLIPIAVFVVTVICFVLAMLLEAPTDKGTAYSVFGLIGIFSIILSPLPCLGLSVVGIIFSIKAKKDGISKAILFLVLGIIEILSHSGSLILAVLMFIVGQGV